MGRLVEYLGQELAILLMFFSLLARVDKGVLAIIQYEKALAGTEVILFESCSNWLFTNDTVTDIPATSMNGVSIKYGDELHISNINGYHEGLYKCSSDHSVAVNLTVYAVPHFQSFGTHHVVSDGQSTVLNISLDYVNGGARGAKQNIYAVILKKAGAGSSLLYCYTDGRGCSVKNSFIQNYTPTDAPSNFTASVKTSNVNISDSGTYEAKVELNDINNQNYISVISSTLTLSVIPKPTATYSASMHSTITTQQVMMTSSSISSSSIHPSPTSLPPAVQCNSKYKYDIYLCSKDALVAIVSMSDKSTLLYEWIEGVLKKTSTNIDSFKKNHSNCLSQYKGSTTKARVNGIQTRELKRNKINNCKTECAGLVAKMLRLVDQTGCNE
ncbi:PREDICTED: uncharacterized protein LOC109591057 [Amphimedon queenslandica]|uniref:Ig-like domain-containing protein n=1 Tax=Amphimedon queenslandica TaxID=400682 RepID=A0A1X7VM90_AMPQE|nr:PREDICTED: uncharacterized protein LOC109591057 [Amphimedon queenslandica]|eukprot:XP_019862424.1 PREDICTED: uncharacterized protein LOC109591057 [Amphimedon queenslandica]